MLRTNVGLQHLNLQGNKIGQRGALALASALRINRDLRWLNLQLNHIGSAAAAVLLDSMQNGEAASKGGGGLDALLLEHNMVLGGLSMGSRAEISEASGAGRTDAGHTVDADPARGDRCRTWRRPKRQLAPHRHSSLMMIRPRYREQCCMAASGQLRRRGVHSHTPTATISTLGYRLTV